MYKLSPDKTKLIEQPSMEKPDRNDIKFLLIESGHFNYDLYNPMLDDYNEHLSSLRSLLIVGDIPKDWEGKDLEEGKDFEINDKDFIDIDMEKGGKIIDSKVAIPLTKEVAHLEQEEKEVYLDIFFEHGGISLEVKQFKDAEMRVIIQSAKSRLSYCMNAWEAKQLVDFIKGQIKTH